MIRNRVLAALFLVVNLIHVNSFDYPQVLNPIPGDPVYAQHQQDIRLYHLRSRTNEQIPPLLLYRYDASDHDSVLTVAARFNLPYSSLVTLNGLTGTDLQSDERELLIPSVPGIFVPDSPRNHLDRVMAALRSASKAEGKLVRVATRSGERIFRFFLGEDFSTEERLTFLGAMFKMPLEYSLVTSAFGYRRHPITGIVQFHRGVDLAAPMGSPVRASADGGIRRIGIDPLLGTFVVIEHRGGYETYYAHLSKVEVRLNEAVSSGTIVGRVGTTGLTTGPHLHFELREEGQPTDPLLLLPRMRNR